MITALRHTLKSLRRHAGAFVTDGLFRGLSTAGAYHPQAKPERHGVEVLRDISYLPADARRPAALKLDVYRRQHEDHKHHNHHRAHAHPKEGLRPVVLYVHGGGFRILSKDTHWVMALAYARRGYVVFNIDYRLAPKHPFPAALEDVCAAYRWVVEHAKEYGGDPSRIVLAGESAGANLVTALAVTTTFRRPESYAAQVFDLNVVPRAVVAACGVLQVSDIERFARRRKIPAFYRDRLDEVAHAYIGEADTRSPGGVELADPLCILESGATPDRPLPPFFAPCGTKDLLLDDTRRLSAAIDKLGGECEARYYEGEVHAFHALVFRPAARACWAHTFEFAKRHIE
jgi:acetyl esterase